MAWRASVARPVHCAVELSRISCSRAKLGASTVPERSGALRVTQSQARSCCTEPRIRKPSARVSCLAGSVRIIAARRSYVYLLVNLHQRHMEYNSRLHWSRTWRQSRMCVGNLGQPIWTIPYSGIHASAYSLSQWKRAGFLDGASDRRGDRAGATRPIGYPAAVELIADRREGLIGILIQEINLEVLQLDHRRPSVTLPRRSD